MPALAPAARVALVSLLAIAGACTYAWPLGPSDEDAGDASPTDGGTDRTTAADGPALSDADSATTDAGPPVDAPPGDAANCAKLQSDLKSARAAARQCFEFSGECLTTQIDECGCKVYVEYPAPTSLPAVQYQAALNAFEDAGCPKSCGTPCSTSVSSICVIQDAGTSFACSP